MKSYILVFLITISQSLTAQVLNQSSMFVNDLNGTPLAEKSEVNIKGSSFLNSDWQHADLVHKNGTLYRNISVKLNLQTQEVHFLDQNKQEMICSKGDILEINFKETQDSKFKLMRYQGKDEFFQILLDDTISFVKSFKASVVQSIQFNSATKEQTISIDILYFLLRDGEFIPFKKQKKSLISAFGDHELSLSNFIKESRVSMNSESDIISIIKFYLKLKDNPDR